MFLNHLTRKKPIRNKESNALSHISWVLYLSWRYFNMKGFSETTLSHNSLVRYRSETGSNTNEQVSTDLSHISWMLYQSGQSGKLRALHAHVPMFWCVNMPCMLMCSRALYAYAPCILTCSYANVPCVLTCLAYFSVLTWQRALHAYVLTCYNYEWQR